MKTRLSLLIAVGLPVLLLLTFWLFLVKGSASTGSAPAELPAGTIVGGSIITDTTWTPAGSPYILQTQNVTVIDNVRLTIEGGVTVEFNAGRSLWVNGTLLAVGTPTQPITFTRMAGATQPWGSLQIGRGSVLNDSNASQISYATIEGGGSSAQMLYVYNSAPTLDHLTLHNSRTGSVPNCFSLRREKVEPEPGFRKALEVARSQKSKSLGFQTADLQQAREQLDTLEKEAEGGMHHEG